MREVKKYAQNSAILPGPSISPSPIHPRMNG